MSARNPRIALHRYAQPLEAALRCVTPVSLRPTATELGLVEVLRFPNDIGVELRRIDHSSGRRLGSIYFLVHQHYGILATSPGVEPRSYSVVTDGYSYVVQDQQQREILAFHWHPGRRSHEHDPHVHIGSAVVDSGSSDIGKTFSRFHIPTGHISIAQVVRLLLTDFNVVPNRQDWEVVLAGILPADRS